ncbi:hypothetical protein CRUP_012648 [Coryphaenoides rupestris]|nr:hypothetical protein CRUP_012648 [Coryphaenoides rupestris]
MLVTSASWVQLLRDWEEVRVVVVRPGAIPTSSPCGNTIPADDRLTTTLPAGSRFVVVPRPVCLEKGVAYTLRLEFTRYGDAHGVLGGGADTILLIDSVSSMFTPEGESCRCDPQGSVSSLCDVRGGQCRCRPNVIGRRCDQCAPGTYGFGPSGCKVCGCSIEGSVSRLCDGATGQCRCRAGAFGPRCDGCQSGHWGFPNCRPCQCNGHAQECHQKTGVCINCRENTGGDLCDSIEGSVSRLCDGATGQCRCRAGAFGPRCDGCQSGHWGFPNCRPCQCNGHAQECHQKTGVCINCRENTGGDLCDR